MQLNAAAILAHAQDTPVANAKLVSHGLPITIEHKRGTQRTLHDDKGKVVYKVHKFDLAGCIRDRRKALEATIAKYLTNGPKNKCWLWTGRVNARDGHGVVSLFYRGRRTSIVASRLIWILAHGMIDDSVQVCHNCPKSDNPLCGNLAHLFAADNERHTLDKLKKRQFASGSSHGTRTKPWAVNKKLSDEDVGNIRRSYRPRYTTQSMLAEQYGVSEHLIYLILKNKIRRRVCA